MAEVQVMEGSCWRFVLNKYGQGIDQPADEKNWRSLVNVMCITLKPRSRTAGYVRNNNKKKENVSI